MRRKWLLIGAVFSILVSQAASGQQRWQHLKEQWAQQDSSRLMEKVYLQTDHETYVCGEVLWIKAFVLEARTHLPVDFSRVLYVELLDPEGRPVWQSKLALNDGQGAGSFDLPFTLTTGTYILRAYTSQMENQGPQRFFIRPLAIVNTARRLPAAAMADSTPVRIELYPEGGTLLQGKKQLLAVQVSGSGEEGLARKVRIQEVDGTILDSLVTDESGLGTFWLTPRSGASYALSVRDAAGKWHTAPVPTPTAYGYHIHVSSLAHQGWEVQGSATTAEGSPPDVFLVVHQNDHVEFAVMATTNSQGSFHVFIPQDSLNPGVSELTVFDARMLPVCGRLLYQPPHATDRLGLKVTSGESTWSTRTPVHLGLKADGPPGDTAWCAVSVYRSHPFLHGRFPDLASYMWLGSDLYRPDWSMPSAFLSVLDSSMLEHVLLTYGYRSYIHTGNSDFRHPVIRYVPELSGPVITARALEPDGRPARHVHVYFSLPGRNFQFGSAYTDSLGIARFYPRPFYGSHQLVLQPDPSEDSSVRLDVMDPYFEGNDGIQIPQLHVDSSWRPYISEAQLGVSTQKAYEPRWYRQLETPRLDTLPFYGRPYKTYHLDDYTRYTTMEEVLREYVAEVNPRFKRDRWHFYMFDVDAFAMNQYVVANTVFQNDPLVLMDGVPIFNLNALMHYDPLNVADLDLVDRHYYYGDLSMDGIMSFRTYHGDLNNFVLNPHAVVLDYAGLELRRRYPDVQHIGDPSDAHLPDFRQVLYWNPRVAVPCGKSTDLKFGTGDLKGEFRVVVQGVDQHGRLGSSSTFLDVR